MTGVQKILWGVAGAALLVFAGLVLMANRATAPPADTPFRPTFALPDAAGRLRTAEEFSGKHLLVFFGFTNCPDVCPMALIEVAQVMDGLGGQADLVQPLFISIDPTRDRSLELAEYTAAFHPSILGLAGDEAQTRAAARSFRIFYEREDSSGAPDGYTMAHSAALYLIGPDGNWLRQFSYGTPASEILNDLRQRL